MSALAQHPLSASFPSMPEDELNALAGDIKAHGLHSSIVLYKGQVLDGWHRYRACILGGVNPRTMEYKGNDPVAFVKSANWHRRHMTASQRAMAHVALSEWREPGRKNNSAILQSIPPTSGEMAKEAGVSTRTIDSAKTVEAKGTEAVKAAVRDGSIPVHKAAEIATLPKREQNKVLAEPKPTPKLEKKEAAPSEGEEFAPDLVAELERADKEIRSLQGLVESLQTSDLAKEVRHQQHNGGADCRGADGNHEPDRG